MKKIVLFSVAFFMMHGLMAQVDTLPQASLTLTPTNETTPKPEKKQYNLSNRANDHFLLQLGYTSWMGKPDSIHTKGFPRSINAYFMFDFPFKATPQISAAIGLGVGSDRIFFDSTFVDVKGASSTLRFNRNPYGNGTSFKKTVLNTTYLEAPVELRFVNDPEHSDKSFKAAIGVKVGTMIKAGTRNRTLRKSNYPADYLLKEASKKYFNTTRVVGTARIGIGNFTVFGTYQFTKLLKEGAGPELRPFTIGLSIGGL